MSLLNKLFKTKDKQQAALPVVTREAPKVVQPPREPSPAELVFRHFQAAMSEEDPVQRKKEIAAITNAYWLARLVKEGRYETDRVQALQQLKDQNRLLEIAIDSSNLPKIQGLAQDKLDDAHRFRLIEKPYISEADKCRAAAKISDTKLLTEILLRGGFGRTVNLTAARRLELIAPEEAKHYEDIINFLRRKF